MDENTVCKRKEKLTVNETIKREDLVGRVDEL